VSGGFEQERLAVEAIVNGRVTVLPGGHLQLPEGAEWPFCDHRILYVREFYAPLYEDVLGRLDWKETKMTARTKGAHHIVIGQPGIGKSVFG